MAVPRTSAAERQRRFRQRQRAGLRSVPVVVDEHRTFALLVAAGYLGEADAPDALAQALERMIADLRFVDEKNRYALLSPTRTAR